MVGWLPGDYEGCVLLLERAECTYAPLVSLWIQDILREQQA